MTLLLGIATQRGIWQSSDHRLTTIPEGKLVTDASVKHLGITARDGVALVSYTGIGQLALGPRRIEDLSDWLRKAIRGEDRGLEDLAQHLARSATGAFGRWAFDHGVLHVFAMGAFLRGQAWIVLIANTDTPDGNDAAELRRDFVVSPIQVTNPVPVFGGGGAALVSHTDRSLLHHVSRKRPRRANDYLGLLAAVNRRAAESRPSGPVSPGCVAGYLPSQGAITLRSFGDASAFDGGFQNVPYIFRSVDWTEVNQLMMSRVLNPLMDKVSKAERDEALRRSVRATRWY